MARGPRVRMARGIYRDQYGIAAVSCGKERRYAPGTKMETIQRWQEDYKRRRKKARGARRGTLTADVDLYIDRIQHLASWRERRAELRAWTALYGPWKRGRIQRKDVIAARQAWLAAGVKPKTCNHRLASLRALWRELDGRDTLTPVDDVLPLPVPSTPVVTVTPETILTTYRGLLAGEQRGTLRSAKTRARFMVLASSGVRPSELMRAKPEDVDLGSRVWRTRDGKGGHRPGGLFLFDDLFVAWTTFIEANAWGKFETSAFARTLREAGWPAGVRPYCLRHSVGVALSEAGQDLADVGAWLGHSRPDTTRSHYVPVLAGRIKGLGDSLAGRLQWPTDGTK